MIATVIPAQVGISARRTAPFLPKVPACGGTTGT